MEVMRRMQRRNEDKNDCTPTLTGKDAMNVINQVLKASSAEAVKKNKEMLELRKRIERT